MQLITNFSNLFIFVYLCYLIYLKFIKSNNKKKQQINKLAKNVSFNNSVKVMLIPNRSEIDQITHNKLWYRHNDYIKFRKSLYENV